MLWLGSHSVWIVVCRSPTDGYIWWSISTHRQTLDLWWLINCNRTETWKLSLKQTYHWAHPWPAKTAASSADAFGKSSSGSAASPVYESCSALRWDSHRNRSLSAACVMPPEPPWLAASPPLTDSSDRHTHATCTISCVLLGTKLPHDYGTGHTLAFSAGASLFALLRISRGSSGPRSLFRTGSFWVGVVFSDCDRC